MKSSSATRGASVYLELLQQVYIDCMERCGADVDVRDLRTVKSRVEAEGMSFLTITLPAFCKDFEQALADGQIAPTHFHRFPRLGSRRKQGSVPKFLQGVIGRLFDVKTGELKSDEVPPSSGGPRVASSVLVFAVRQVCRLFAKVELECSKERIDAAIANFVKIEQELSELPQPEHDDAFFNVSRALWDNLVVGCNTQHLVPAHGPGAVSERKSSNGKYVWERWHERLDTYFPLLGNAYPLSIVQPSVEGETYREGWFDSEWYQTVSLVPEEEEQPVRVVLVPKTLKSPRVIAIEPACMQYVQQGIRNWLYDELERYHLTAGHINFRDQTINQRLAVTASATGQWATIDLSDASDRVPYGLALSMFSGNPDLMGAIDVCRSTKAMLPDGTVIGPLKKFASMGSALCFPVESMYFFTIVVMALCDDAGLSYTQGHLRQVSRLVYVYGDDLLVPADKAPVVCEYLAKYNCKVNRSKSFWTGKFRESCGQDAFDGSDVTPIYVRQRHPTYKRQAKEIVSWVATANLLMEKGLIRGGNFMFNYVEQVLGPLPYLDARSEALGRKTTIGYVCPAVAGGEGDRHVSRTHQYRTNRRLQRREVKAYVPVPVFVKDTLDDHPALAKCLLALERRPEGAALARKVDTEHLERSARHGAVALTRRWVPA